VAGGIDPTFSKISSRCFFFFPKKNGRVEALPGMQQPRYAHTAVYLEPSGVMVIGGRTYGSETDSVLDSVEFFEFETRKWRSLAVTRSVTISRFRFRGPTVRP
jgi:hypothetical protein